VISSTRGRSLNPVGGEEGWHQGASFAPGGGDGGRRNWQAAVAAIRVTGEEREERGESVQTVWVGLTDPMAQLVDLVQPGGLG
jgi:hypothetical protein